MNDESTPEAIMIITSWAFLATVTKNRATTGHLQLLPGEVGPLLLSILLPPHTEPPPQPHTPDHVPQQVVRIGDHPDNVDIERNYLARPHS